ncbi:NAD(P)H-binding protein [Nocardia sp. NPDC051030]|uniref:NAD(P)H-binding protein n=1 Tax=Nocardia sp. NPDC051030 TaxID=3155162 RepID=UPI00341D9667
MLLLTGATGNIGRELTRELTRTGTEFRALIRNPARAADLPATVDPFIGDLTEPSTLTPAFADVTTLFLLIPGIGTDLAHNALTAAQSAGVRRMVLLSSIHAMIDPLPAMGRWHRDREDLVHATGIPATIIRPGGYMTNALEWAPAIRAGHPIDDPTGPGRYAPIHPADIAAVIAKALIEDGHEGNSYNLTGPESFTVAEQVAVLAQVLNREIKVLEAATPEEALRSRYPNGAPPALASAILEWFTLMRADTIGLRTDTVTELLSRQPRTFESWCQQHRAAFEPAAPANLGIAQPADSE